MVCTFLLAHFHHIIEQLRFRQSSVGSIFLSAGEAWRDAQEQSRVGYYDALIDTLQKGLETDAYKYWMGTTDYGRWSTENSSRSWVGSHCQRERVVSGCGMYNSGAGWACRCGHSKPPSPAFQFSYTAVFGAYTAFLFIRTGWSSALSWVSRDPQMWVEEG